MTNNTFKQTEIGEIPEDWSKTNIGSLVSSISKTFDFSSVDDVVFLNTGDISEGKVLVHDKVSKIGLPGQAKKTIQKDDILLSEIRPKNKRFAYVDFDADDYVVSTKMMVLRSNGKVNPKYIYYHLTSEEILAHLQMLAESRSGTFPQITFDQVSSLDISLPQPAEQDQIIDFIQALDGKIELNRRMNKTLEEIGKALFKQWFVDFEFPYDFAQGKPNLNGKPYKSSGGEMVESELGEIPRGWKVHNLGNFSEIHNGFAFKSGDYQEDGIVLVRTRDFTEGGYVNVEDPVYLPESFYESYSKYRLNKFDILLVMVGASVGKRSFVTSSSLPSLQNQNMWNFRVKDKGQLFLKYQLDRLVEKNIGSASGSAREFFRKDHFRTIPFVLPQTKILSDFEDSLESFYNQIDTNISENTNLIKIRDSLLPRLMSGKIRV